MARFFLSLSVSAAVAGLLYLGIRAKKLHPAWLLVLALSPVALLYMAFPHTRVYSKHGFLHIGIVYRIAAGQIPPNSTLLGEERLHYPWLHHWIVANVAQWFDLSPATIFAAINLLCLMLTLVLLFRAALMLNRDRLAAIFAATLSIFGSTIFNVGPIANGLRVSEGRALAAIKYARMNSMPLGIALFAVYLWAMFRIFDKPGTAKARDYALLVASMLGSGLLYPLTWLPLFACLAATCAAFLTRYGRAAKGTLISVSISTVISLLLLVPYFNSLRAGQDSFLLPEFNITSLLGKVVRLSLGFSLVAMLAWWKRHVVKELLTREPGRLIALLSTILVTAAMYVFVDANRNEYKFLILSCLSLGLLAGGLQAEAYRSHRALSFLMSVAFLIPVSSDWIAEARTARVADPYLEEGFYLRHANAAEDRLYQWIGSQTPGDAVFIDSYLTVPVFGRRALYVGLDERRENGLARGRDGWSLRAASLIRQEGHPRDVVKSKVDVAQRVLDPNLSITLADVAQMGRPTGKQVYIIARNPATREKLNADGRFRVVYACEAASVFRPRGREQ